MHPPATKPRQNGFTSLGNSPKVFTMHKSITSFISARCTTYASARMELVEFIRAFRDSLPARSKDSWPRGRIVAALAEAGYQIGTADKIYWVARLSLKGEWRAVNGRMELSRAR